MDRVKQLAARMSLRKPQVESLTCLDKVAKLVEWEKKDEQAVMEDLRKLQKQFPSVEAFERDFLSLCFALATGVGKTRLMGAFIAYLYTEGKSRNFFVLAPNLTIYRKLIADFTPGTKKYVFKGIPELESNQPRVITGENYADGIDVLNNNLFDNELHINIFNVAKINTEVRGGKSPKIKRLNEWIGESYFDYLASLNDLVLLMDESHRYRATAGVRVLNELKPLIGLEFTATPQVESNGKTVPFQNIIYQYSLHKALRDGYVKEPVVATRENFESGLYTEAELEKVKMEDGLFIHENTKTELAVYAKQAGVQVVKPFMLFIAKDQQHAELLKTILESEEVKNGAYQGKVLTIHSSKRGLEKDEVIEKLVHVESPDSDVEIVIHVNMLKEGWDVTNLYTIVPLRAAKSKTLVEQAIGRGLRLPYGEKTGVKEIDRLTIVAHDHFQEIIDEANVPESFIKEGLVLGSSSTSESKKMVEARPLTEDNIIAPVELHKEVIQATKNEVRKLEGIQTTEALSKYAEELAQKVERLLVHQDKQVIKQTVLNYVLELKLQMDIPDIVFAPSEKVDWGFKPFKLQATDMVLKPLSSDLFIHSLLTDERQRFEHPLDVKDIDAKRVLIERLTDYPEVSYEEHAPLLHDLVKQMMQLLAEQYPNETVPALVLHYKEKVSQVIYDQLKNAYYENNQAGAYQASVVKGFQLLEPLYFAVEKKNIRPVHQPPQEKMMIRQLLFEGFQKCLYPYQRFDSDSERRLTVILEEDHDVIKWFKPAKEQLHIRYGQNQRYVPDFIIETSSDKLLCEVKRSDEQHTDLVIDKAKAAAQWCEVANEYEREHGGKRWKYLLIPHDQIQANQTVESLLSHYEWI